MRSAASPPPAGVIRPMTKTAHRHLRRGICLLPRPNGAPLRKMACGGHQPARGPAARRRAEADTEAFSGPTAPRPKPCPGVRPVSAATVVTAGCKPRTQRCCGETRSLAIGTGCDEPMSGCSSVGRPALRWARQQGSLSLSRGTPVLRDLMLLQLGVMPRRRPRPRARRGSARQWAEPGGVRNAAIRVRRSLASMSSKAGPVWVWYHGCAARGRRCWPGRGLTGRTR